MIHNEQEYKTTLERISHFQKQVEHLRKVETTPENYRLSSEGFLAELDRMNLEVREYLWSHPSQTDKSRRIARQAEQNA
jgi:hypothetical protein